MIWESPVPLEASSPPVQAAGLKQLERQVERGSLFAHSVMGEGFIRQGELEVLLHALVDVLLERGTVSEHDIVSGVSKVRSELAERNDVNGGRVMIRPDSVTDEPVVPVRVDCQARLPICHAVCCRLHFALSAREVEAGKVKWDLGQPYFIRHESNGCCTHLDPAPGGCNVYQDRPLVCREYSCAADGRIWKDFPKMELNTEWIDENLSAPPDPRIVRIMMQPGARPLPSGDTSKFQDVPHGAVGELTTVSESAP